MSFPFHKRCRELVSTPFHWKCVESKDTPTTSVRLQALGLLSAVIYALLAWKNQEPKSLTLSGYYLLYASCWITFAFAWTTLRQRPNAQVSIRSIVLWAAVFRIIGGFAQPLFEDDFYRYLWDGRQFAVSGNPYASTPKDHFQDPGVSPEFQPILDGVNYPDLPTIYAPMLQYAFLVAYWIHPAHLWPLKALWFLADVGILCWLWRIGGPLAVFLYGWCPLAVQETAFTAHPDVLGAFFLIAALGCWKRSRYAWTSVLMGGAIATKITGILVAPFLFKGRSWRFVAICIGTLAMLYLPFWIQGSAGDTPSLIAFMQQWEFNSGGFALLRALLGNTIGSAVALGVTVVGLGILWWRYSPQDPPRGDWIYGWFFLWSAVVQPWYLIWVLVWIALRPSYTGFTALAVVSLSYLTPLNLGETSTDLFAHATWVRPCEYGGVALAAMIDWWTWRRSRAQSNGAASIPKES